MEGHRRVGPRMGRHGTEVRPELTSHLSEELTHPREGLLECSPYTHGPLPYLRVGPAVTRRSRVLHTLSTRPVPTREERYSTGQRRRQRCTPRWRRLCYTDGSRTRSPSVTKKNERRGVDMRRLQASQRARHIDTSRGYRSRGLELSWNHLPKPPNL